MAKLARIPRWDRRTFYVSWWNYAVYDLQTHQTTLSILTYTHFPEHIQRPPETQLSIASFGGDGVFLFASTFVVESKDVFIQDNTNMFYNSTTRYNVKNPDKKILLNDDIEKDPKFGRMKSNQFNIDLNHEDFEFWHIMDPITNEISFGGNFPAKWDCPLEHPDLVNTQFAQHENIYTRLSNFENEKEQVRKSSNKLPKSFQKRTDEVDYLSATSSNPSNTPNSGTYESDSPIDMDVFIRQHTYDVFIKKQQKAETITDIHQYNYNSTCISHFTFNYTIFPISQGFGNGDIIPAEHPNQVEYEEFVESYVEAFERKNSTLIEEIEKRRIRPKELQNECKNGVSYLQGYVSVADGFFTLKPLEDKYLIRNNDNNNQSDNNGLGIKDLYQIVPQITPSDDLIKGLTIKSDIISPIHNNPSIYQRDFRLEGNCGSLETKSCEQIKQHKFNTILLNKSNISKELTNSLNNFPGYRYAKFAHSSLTTLTPNSITVWSHAPHHSVPSLYHYLISQDIVTGPSLSSIQSAKDQIENNNPDLSQGKKIELLHAKIENLAQERLWQISAYLNRFRWYGGMSYGCCLTRGTPEYRYPWAWQQVMHVFNQNDQLYVYGIPAKISPTGNYILNEIELSKIKNIELKQMIIVEAKRLSFNRDFSKIITLAQSPSYLTLPLPPAYEIISPITNKPISNRLIVKYPFYNDINMVFGDARVVVASLFNAYGTYSFIKLPSFPQLSTRQIVLMERKSWHPSHPLVMGDRDELLTLNNYHDINVDTKQFAKIDHLVTTHYHPDVDSTKQRPILPAITYKELAKKDIEDMMGKVDDFDENNAGFVEQFVHKIKLLILKFIPNANCFFEKYHFAKAKFFAWYWNFLNQQSSTDGHLSLFNVTNTQYALHLDELGSMYYPLQRTFTQETKRFWILTHAVPLSSHSDLDITPRQANFRAPLTMFRDVSPDELSEQKSALFYRIQLVKSLIESMYNSERFGKIPSTLRTLLGLKGIEKIHDDDRKFIVNLLVTLQQSYDSIDGSLITYTDLRTKGLTTLLIYRKNYIPGVNCNEWYDQIGIELISDTSIPSGIGEVVKGNIGGGKSNNKTVELPKKCPSPGDYRYTIWCQDYNNSQITMDQISSANDPSADQFDEFNFNYFTNKSGKNIQNKVDPNNNQNNICVVYTKHMYIPTASASIYEHAHETGAALDIPFMLTHSSSYGASVAHYRLMEALQEEIELFNQQNGY
jgi:hypothetical protein